MLTRMVIIIKKAVLIFVSAILILSLTGCTIIQKLSPTPAPCMHESWDWWVLLHPTKKTEGKRTKACKACHHTFDQEAIEPLPCEHDGAFLEEPIKAPTETEEGVKKRTCLTCERYTEEAPIEPLGFSAEVIKQMYSQSVFKIYAYDYSSIKSYNISQGTGFFIDSKGTFITNAHVIKNCTDYEIVLNGKKYEVGEVLYYDHTNTDLAILRLKNEMETVPVSFSENVKESDPVYAVGFPKDAKNLLVTDGAIYSTAYIIDGVAYYLFDASVTHGSSGGVLSDRHGNVIGVVTLGYDNGINGALKYPFFKHLVESCSQTTASR